MNRLFTLQDILVAPQAVVQQLWQWVSAFSAVTMVVTLLCLSACGGGGDSTPTPTPTPPPTPPTTPTTPVSNCSVDVSAGPFETIWPGGAWESRTPASQGLCPDDLEEASTYAFASGNHTGAVLVIKNGYIVFEEYVADREADDLVTSWSVGKSLTSMLIGLAIEHELIEGLEQSVSDFVPSWSEGAKANITIDYMMTLRTALEVVDAGEFYAAEDQLTMAVERPLIGEPGERLYGYSNADVMVAGEVIRMATGMSAQAYLDRHVGSMIGFEGEWWTDSLGNMLTYCCIDSTARDFARFGLLYARNGLWESNQVISSEWIELSTAPALAGTYAYYWWPVARDGFGAFGLQGQMVVVYPEHDLIVLRFTRYVRQGDGSVIRSGLNYHDTPAPENFDNGAFLTLVRDSVPN